MKRLLQTGDRLMPWTGPAQFLAWLLSLTTCAHNWQSPLYLEHELVGSIWHSRSGTYMEQAVLLQHLSKARYVILGEKHDNPDHHALQLQLLNELIDQGGISQLTLEMLDSSSDQALAELLEQSFDDPDELIDYLGWDSAGWNWDFYGPIVEAAYRASLPLLAGNISRESMRAVYAEPARPEIADVLDMAAVKQLGLEIQQSHCNSLPAAQIPDMVKVQQTRDFTMAKQLSRGSDGKTTVLIAGNYHARHDLGVPEYLLAQDETLQRSQILSLSFMEVQPVWNDPAAYLEQSGEQPHYDFIWFTPAVTKQDYCDSLRK